MKKLLGALAIALLAAVLSAPPAEAHGRCWWDGYSWVCKKHRHHVRHYRPSRPYWPYAHYPRQHYSYYRPYYGPRVHVYACLPPFCW